MLSFARQLAVVVVASAIACAPSGPTVHLSVVNGPDVASLDRFTRLVIEVARCDVPETEKPAVIDVPTTGGEDATKFELQVPPGAPFNAWLQGWEVCPGPCVPDHLAKPGDCRCVKVEPDRQAITADGCTEWLVVPEGEIRVALTLTATAGLCPIARDRCP